MLAKGVLGDMSHMLFSVINHSLYLVLVERQQVWNEDLDA